MFDIFDFSDPLSLAVLTVALEEENQEETLEITLDSPDQIDQVVALVEERFGPERAAEVRRMLEEHFGLS